MILQQTALRTKSFHIVEPHVLKYVDTQSQIMRHVLGFARLDADVVQDGGKKRTEPALNRNLIVTNRRQGIISYNKVMLSLIN